MIFVKHLTEFYQISLKNLPYHTDFSPLLMACMQIQIEFYRKMISLILHESE